MEVPNLQPPLGGGRNLRRMSTAACASQALSLDRTLTPNSKANGSGFRQVLPLLLALAYPPYVRLVMSTCFELG